MKRLFLRAYHLWLRIWIGAKGYARKRRNFGFKVAGAIFLDGLKPKNKTEKYIETIELFVDAFAETLVEKYKKISYIPTYDEKLNIMSDDGKVPVWCCWWQGEESMTELVKMCYHRLQEAIPTEIAKLHLITLDNYKEYVVFPERIQKMFEEKKINMTEMSDILRMNLLSTYGGLWIDATVYISSTKIPQDFFLHKMYSQRMYDPIKHQREACKGRWCGFMMGGSSDYPMFAFVRDAFYQWWEKYDCVIDYVLIDYLILTAYKRIPYVKETVDMIPDNNVEVFTMYGKLNEPYSKELFDEFMSISNVHKLTNKMELKKVTKDGVITLYGYLLKRELVC